MNRNQPSLPAAAAPTGRRATTGLVALVVAVPLAALPPAPAAAVGDAWELRTTVPASDTGVETKLTAADGAHGDLFGKAVAVDGDTALVGARGVDVGDQDEGAVYAFTRDGDSWVERQKLVAADAGVRDEFGTELALAGDTALIGAAGHDGAYVFTRDGGEWAQEAKLVAEGTDGNDYYGATVALSADGDTAVVGAWGADLAAPNQGAVYVFTRDGGEWVEQTRLTASDGHDWAIFGVDVAISPDGQTIVVGAELTTVGTERQGQAYVFGRDGDGWAEQAILRSPDDAPNQRFGGGVAVADGTVLVGAHEAPGGGAAHVFTADAAEWTLRSTLTGSEVTEGGWFGHRVALAATGQAAVVGARNSRDQFGSAYVYTGEDGEWGEHAALTASDEEWNFQFGNAVDVSGDTVLVGAWTSRVGEVTNQGAAYAYELDLPGSEPEPEPVVCDETVAGVHPETLTVTDGVTCLAAGAQVLGAVNVSGGAGLVAGAAVVQGPVQAVGAAVVDVSFSQVTGPVLVSGVTDELRLLGNQVTGSVSVVGGDTGDRPVVVAGNTVIGSLACFDNAPAPSDQGWPNIATAGALGQCAQ